jgi:hypothetical protein
MVIAGFLAPSLFADWQGQAALLDQLRTAYPRTVLDAGGIKVVRPGTVLVVQLNGLQANPLKSDPFKNRFEDGQVSAGARKPPVAVPYRLPNNPFAPQPRYLAVYEKVYLLDLVSGGDARGDALVLTVQTCGTCDPSAADSTKPYRASISFNFYSGFLAATDLKRAQDAIGMLLAYSQTAAPESAQPATAPARQDTPQAQPATDPERPTLRHADEPQAPAQNQTAVAEPPAQPTKFPVLTPPPPPPETNPATPAQPPTLRRPGEGQAQTQPVAEPTTQPDKLPELKQPPAPPAGAKAEIKTEVKPPDTTTEVKPNIEIGWTRDKVEAALGKPGNTVKDRGQEIYLYEHMKVVFEHGKVVGSSK